MTDSLATCPFCGREAEQDFQQSYRDIQTGRVDHGAAVYCTGCNANMIMCRGDHPGLSDEERMAVVVEDWNRRTPPPQTHVAAGRWRVFEDTTPGYWGIELEAAGNDDDAIMYPQKIHRDTVARIVEAHNAALLPSPEPNLTMLLQSKAEGIRTEYQLAHGRPCDCSTPDSALHYGRAQGLEIAADVIGAEPSPQPNVAAGRWLPIEQADKSVDRIYDLPGMPSPIANSEEYWCRDADGRVFHATWADDGKRSYWWDLDGESPVDPVEFMPHPLDPRFANQEGKDNG